MRHTRPGDAALQAHSFVVLLFVEAGVRLVRGESRMYAVPDVEEVVAVAKELGIHLGPEEAVVYRKFLMEQMREFDTFVQARLEEPRPPMVSAARQPGYQPRPDEDLGPARSLEIPVSVLISSEPSEGSEPPAMSSLEQSSSSLDAI